METSTTKEASARDTKLVRYMDVFFEVPNKAKWIAADSDGEVCWYVLLPTLEKTYLDYVPGSHEYGFAGFIGRPSFPCEAC